MEPCRNGRKRYFMIKDKILEMLKKKSGCERQEVIRLRWKKAELERLLQQKKQEKSAY